jgi:DNA-binding XRE family transcriptional regulator
MKKNKTVSFETVLNRQLQSSEFRLEFEQKQFYLHVARLIATLRNKAGITQAALAKAAKVCQPLIARIERGDQSRTPTFETLAKILKALGYRVELNVVPEKKAA